MDRFDNDQVVTYCDDERPEPRTNTETLDTITERWLQEVEIDQTLPPVTVTYTPLEERPSDGYIIYESNGDVRLFVDDSQHFSLNLPDDEGCDRFSVANLRALIAICDRPDVRQWAGLTSEIVDTKRETHPAEDANGNPTEESCTTFACGRASLDVYDRGVIIFGFDKGGDDVTATDLFNLRTLLGIPDIEDAVAMRYYHEGYKEGEQAAIAIFRQMRERVERHLAADNAA